jgi:hypothetical protein
MAPLNFKLTYYLQATAACHAAPSVFDGFGSARLKPDEGVQSRNVSRRIVPIAQSSLFPREMFETRQFLNFR